MTMKRFITQSTLALMTASTAAFGQDGVIRMESRVAGQLHPAVAGPVAGIASDRLIVAGGAWFPDGLPWKGGAKTYEDAIHAFEPKGDCLLEVPVKATLPERLAYSANCSTPQGVFFAGGENAAGISDRVGLIRWDDSSATVVVETLPPLPVPLTNASAAHCDRRVYVAGGETPKGPTGQCWFLDLGDLEGGWSPLPSLPRPASHAVLTAVEVDYMIVLQFFGGRCKKSDGISEIHDSVYELSPSEGKWIDRPSLPHPLSAATGVALGTRGALLFGGDRGTVFSKVERHLAAIAGATDPAEKERLTLEKNEMQESHPGFGREVLFYDRVTGRCSQVGDIAQEGPVTTTALWWQDAVFIPSGEVRPGVRTPDILRIQTVR